MKILEITAFSSGFCGIWFRVSKEAELLAEKGHEVHVFSSNIHRGSGKIENAPIFEQKNKLKIHRFPTKFKVGENTFFWNYEKEALKLKPDVIICHAYRQYYSTKALKIAKQLGIPCILVTHAPFLEVKTRGLKLSLIAWLYDFFIGKRIINKYSKIFAISKWEIPYLIKLGAKKERIIYMPNGIPKEFFKTKMPKQKSRKQKQILFLGRIAPIKDIETLIKAFSILIKKHLDLSLNLVGPEEKGYSSKIKSLIKELSLENHIKFSGPVYNTKEKIEITDSSDIFVLPSKREGMPQALVEAMARKKIIVASDISAIREIISDAKNGYLFEQGNPEQLAKKLMLALEKSSKNREVSENARKSVKQFSWDKIIERIERAISPQ